MIRYRTGDCVSWGDRRGMIREIVGRGDTGVICGISFADQPPSEHVIHITWIMASQLEPVVERPPVALRVVAGTQHH